MHRRIVLCLLALALLPAVAPARQQRSLSPADLFAKGEKELKAGRLLVARDLFDKVGKDEADVSLRRRAFDRLLDIAHRLELHDHTVRTGRRYLPLLRGPA